MTHPATDPVTDPAPDGFVPAGFAVPGRLEHPSFVLVPLGPQHNAADLAAWSGSIEHIRATPGFAGRRWPPEEGMSSGQNLADLVMHAEHFAERVGFTYTVLDPADGDVLGCVYVYPDDDGGPDARVRSWVRVERAELDRPLWAAVSRWLARDWPFRSVAYAAR